MAALHGFPWVRGASSGSSKGCPFGAHGGTPGGPHGVSLGMRAAPAGPFLPFSLSLCGKYGLRLSGSYLHYSYSCAKRAQMLENLWCKP